MFMKMLREKTGAALVEYGLLIAGVALISAASVSLFGHKTSDLVATVAAILPGAHTDDNAPIVSGKLIETAPIAAAAGSPIALDLPGIVAKSGTARLGQNVGGTAGATNIATLVLEAN